MPKTLKELAKEAKNRIRSGFWAERKEDLEYNIAIAKENGISERRAGKFTTDKISASLKNEKEDGFYLQVKRLLDEEGEVSDAIGRLTDREYYETLSFEEKQRYNLSLSERYLKALKRYREESEFKMLKTVDF